MTDKILADLVIRGAKELLTLRGLNDGPRVRSGMQNLGIIHDGAIAVRGKHIVFVGKSRELSNKVDLNHAKTINANGKVVMPGFVDPHTHLVFAGSREEEFIKKMQGVEYLEILRMGGGILNTVRSTQKASFGQLVSDGLKRVNMALRYGTTTIEIKSGYGLSLGYERKILEVIRRIRERSPIDVVSTFLGAHDFPTNVSRESYMTEVLWMISEVSKRQLAEYCDVFCEDGVFSLDESRRILEKAKECGMKLKLHAGEFNDLKGVKLGVELGATSIDHLDHISEEQMRMMAESKTVGVLLPGVPFHLAKDKYAPARRMIDAGVPTALATDFNPGSCPTLSMQMIIALACRYMKMTPEEAIVASTINAAYAIDRAHEVGSLKVGKKADIIILDIPTYLQLPYWFGMNLVETVIKNGEVVVSKNAQ